MPAVLAGREAISGLPVENTGEVFAGFWKLRGQDNQCLPQPWVFPLYEASVDLPDFKVSGVMLPRRVLQSQQIGSLSMEFLIQRSLTYWKKYA